MTPTPTGLTRLTVNLAPKSTRDLDEASEREGRSKTDIANRAIQLYNRLTAQVDIGGAVILRDAAGNERELTLL